MMFNNLYLFNIIKEIIILPIYVHLVIFFGSAWWPFNRLNNILSIDVPPVFGICKNIILSDLCQIFSENFSVRFWEKSSSGFSSCNFWVVPVEISPVGLTVSTVSGFAKISSFCSVTKLLNFFGFLYF